MNSDYVPNKGREPLSSLCLFLHADVHGTDRLMYHICEKTGDEQKLEGYREQLKDSIH